MKAEQEAAGCGEAVGTLRSRGDEVAEVKLDSISLRYAFITVLRSRVKPDYVEEGVPVIGGFRRTGHFLMTILSSFPRRRLTNYNRTLPIRAMFVSPYEVHSVRSASFRWKRSSPDMSSHKAR